MESGREYDAREDIEAGVRIPVLVQEKHGPVLQGDDAATDSHRDIVEVPESLEEDSAQLARVSRLTVAAVKQTSNGNGGSTPSGLTKVFRPYLK